MVCVCLLSVCPGPTLPVPQALVAEKVRQSEVLKKRLAARADAQRRKHAAALEAAIKEREAQAAAEAVSVRLCLVCAPAGEWVGGLRVP